MRPRTLACAAIVFALVAVGPQPAPARVFQTKDDAARAAFPDADAVQKRVVTLDDAQMAQVARLAGSAPASKVTTFFVATKSAAPIGYAFIDIDVVRTLPATFLIVITPDGSVKNIETIAFYEPDEYLPPKPWMAQFDGKMLSPALRLRGEINGIAGATLSSQAVTAAVRRSLARFAVLLKGAR
ncbi:MAG: FMN-binding protein [Candidatus Binataceae bacterium]